MALLRNGTAGEQIASMPGLDFAVAALARAGLITLSIGQAAPIVNQSSTAWFKPAVPTWTAEGVLYLWNAAVGAYQLATPSLWAALFAGGANYSFQSASAASTAILVGTTLLAVQRVAPAATILTLPNLAAQWATGRRLQIVDFSTGVVAHTITVASPDGSTIMQRASWQLRSTADSLAGFALQPSPDLNAWVIAP